MGKKVALVYDFDLTLTPVEMQAQGWIQSRALDPALFWEGVDRFGKERDAENNLAYMYAMAKAGATRQELEEFGERLTFYPGVEDWFDRVNAYAGKLGLETEHFVLSSGLEEMIRKSAIGPHFKRVYASSFLYDEKGKPVWVRRVVDYTNKTQFLFRISKGVLDPSDPAVNDFMPPERYEIPFTHIVYFGDSATDIPCMKLVTSYGGLALGVFDPARGKERLSKLVREKRVGCIAEANYAPGGKIEEILFRRLDALAAADFPKKGQNS